MPVAVVTDSTAYLPDGLAEQRGIRVVPLTVRLGDRIGLDGVDIGPAQLTAELAKRHASVSTSAARAGGVHRLLPRRARRRGLRGGVRAPVPRAVRHLGGRGAGRQWRSAPNGCGWSTRARPGWGWASPRSPPPTPLTAGLAGREVERAAADVAARSRVFFCVDTLEHLRRGGRIGAAAALLGTALAMKPLLHVADGRIVPLEKVRTTARAAVRLVELAAQAAMGGIADLAVHHLGAATRAAELAERLCARLPLARRCLISEVGAAIGAHAGPGLLERRRRSPMSPDSRGEPG